MEESNTQPIVLTTPFAGSTFSASGYPVSFSPDGRWLVFAGGDARIWIWRAKDWLLSPVALCGHAGSAVASIAFSEDGRSLVSDGMDSVSRLWSLPEMLIDRACLRTGRNLSLAEWQRYWGDRNYVRTCPEWPLPEDLIVLVATEYFRSGNVAEVLGRLRKALGNETGDPEAIDELHRQKLSRSLVGSALNMADSVLSSPSDVKSVLHYFDTAFELYPELDLEALDHGVRGRNGLCWGASLEGYAVQVMFACELAVSKATEKRAGYFKDSRGVARALAGDFDGAIDDLEAFIAWAEIEKNDEHSIKERRRWIAKLQCNEYPFYDATLQRLREE